MITGQPENLPSLTGIRGIAATWVVTFHFYYLAREHSFSLDFPGDRLAMAGWSAVDLFFLLSGFMLMHTHAHHFRVFSVQSIKMFAFSRFFRVYPLSLFALAFVYLLITLYPSFGVFYRSLRPGNLSFASFVITACLATRWISHMGDWNEPIWSLSAEIVGYAFFPILAFSANRLRSFNLTLLIAICGIALVIFYQIFTRTLGDDNIGMRGGLLRMIGYFTAGIYLRRALGIHSFSNLFMLILSITSVITLLILPMYHQSTGLLPIPFAVLIFSLYVPSGPVARILSSRVALFLGRISFPLYLIHAMPFQAMVYFSIVHNASPTGYFLYGCLLFIALMMISWLAHLLIERPFHKFATRRFRPVDPKSWAV